MKKSKIVKLVLLASVVSSCNYNTPKQEEKKVYLRSDTTANYSRANGVGSHHGMGYYAFIPYGLLMNNSYRRAGYYSSGISEKSNVGRNPVKGSAVRGGFGRSGSHVSA